MTANSKIINISFYISAIRLMVKTTKSQDTPDPSSIKYLCIVGYLLLKYRLIFLRVWKVFDEPLGESNTERRVKISVGVSKEGT